LGTIGVLESGIDKVEDYLGIENLYETANTPLISFLNNSIRAKELFRKDRDYVVVNGTRPSRPKRASRSRPKTRPWHRSLCRTTSGSTPNSRV